MPPAPEAETDEARKPSWRTRLLMFGVPLALLVGGGWYWLTSGGAVSTDNAYVQMDKVSIAAEVGGRITEVAVRDGQMVDKGQLLFRIDGEPMRRRWRRLPPRSRRPRSMSAIRRPASPRPASTSRRRRRKRWALPNEFAPAGGRSWKGLHHQGGRRRIEAARSNRAAGLAQARADAAEARAVFATGGSGVNPEVESAKVQRAQAQVNLGRTEVRRAPGRPCSSRTGCNSAGDDGRQGSPRQTSAVDTLHPYVEANFKEIDLADSA